MHRAVSDMIEIIEIHNQIRDVFKAPGKVASFVNENTIVRTAAVMEEHLTCRFRCRAPASGKKHPQLEDLLGPWCPTADSPDICMRTLFLMRHFIVHLGGIYQPCDLMDGSKRNLLPAFQEFYRTICVATVKEGDAWCLDAKEVLTPLLQGCLDYWSPGRLGTLRRRTP